ncbi:MAG: NADH-quinone oxidoreductase subunit J [Sediminibacterium sp.]|uniref:NADH-quinone oxidoreductase subunit J n=1 Tax=Sediminibacterium sp. TaxID=1917865 RepID=UPI00271CFC7A|nr:NADH-quinone oxidoreductase subunit J [Sediminibacterium sp.]MDO8996106.1 NADH-quinone oxidoreductase subunit J [Sediminibacterium sp.]
MNFEMILFYLFSIIAILSAVMVIGSRNPVHSVLFLILVFANATGLFLLLGVEFIAMIFLMVYVGAVAVLFLFVVMMLNIKVVQLSENVLRYLPLGAIVGLIFLLQILVVIENDLLALTDFDFQPAQTETIQWAMEMNQSNNIESLGRIMYTNYFYFFIVSGLILLVAMIGAIVLTMYKRGNVKRQDVLSQLTRDFERVVYLKS